MSPKISVVIPIFNEKDNIPDLYKRLHKVVSKITKSYEIIFVNDGSSDNSLAKIHELRKKNKSIKVINFSRNFGHMSAVSAGLKYSEGTKVVVMDADLQDPPEIISELYRKSDKYDVVYAVKKNRKEGPTMTILFKAFYFIQSKLTALPIPTDAGTFSLIDRKVVNILNSLPEKNKFFSGLRAWSGYAQSSVVYERGKRVKGNRKSMSSLFSLALDGIFSFSYAPLRLASFLGFVFATISFVMIVLVLIARLFFGLGIVGWASTMTAVLFIGGIQLITLGIIGEYLARIYDEVKNRPEYVISETFGFSKHKRHNEIS